jgi:uncharacterized protein YecE (DUF72 family)
MSIYVGTAGWSYAQGDGKWDGLFYPRELADRDKLAYYAERFNAVEVNSSFYRPLNPHVVRSWVQKTPPDFRFCAKLYQKFTHPKMFEEATGAAARVQDEDFEVFLAGVEPLAGAGKLGPILAQFPPSFRPDEERFGYLEELVRRLRGEGFGVAVELRHRDWTDPERFGPRTQNLLDEEGVIWVIIDEPKFKTSIRDIPSTGPSAYFRFHGRNYAQWWRHDAAEDRYNYLYTPAEQAELVSEVQAASQQAQDTYAFYNNHYRAKAVVNAMELNATLGLPLGAPPPETLVAEYPELEAVAAGSRS